MNRDNVARALRDMARAADAIAEELSPSELPEVENVALDEALTRLRSIELERALGRAFHPFTRQRPPRA